MKTVLENIFTESKGIKEILDSINDGILIADINETICYINPEYLRIINSTDITGRKLSEARPGAILPKVVKTGKPMSGVYRKLDDIEYIVDMAPIYIDNQVVGGVSIVKDTTEISHVIDILKKWPQVVTHTDKKFIKYNFDSILGISKEIIETKEFAKKLAATDYSVLIQGESGTGKEMFAHAIHNKSNRRNAPFVAVNCASLSASLMETELFGYVSGAFTGANKNGKTGMFQVADSGTIFLDEIGELDITLQAKLLRVLQEKCIRMVGDTIEKPVDVRIIAATNKNLEDLVSKGLFRQDLMYRLNAMKIVLPPLSERKGDPLYLAEHFISELEKKLQHPLTLSDDVKYYIEHNAWIGNIRELKNFLEFSAMLTNDGIIKPTHMYKRPEQHEKILPLKEYISKIEKEYINSILAFYGSDLEGKKKAAEILNISIATLYNKLN